MVLKFCTGLPKCEVCGAPTIEGRIQNCPSVRYSSTGYNKQEAKEKLRRWREQRLKEKIEVDEPSLPKKVWNYSKAVANWKLAGSPERSREEVARILGICETCPLFVRDNRPHCSICGCPCNAGSEPLKNKIKMATEICPLEPPKWT